MKLTENQHSVLVQLSLYPHGAQVCEIAEIVRGRHRYLARAAVRAVLHSLMRKDLCVLVRTRPNTYRLTAKGRVVLVQTGEM